MALSALTELSASELALIAVFAVFSALALRIVYNLYLHPLSGFHGPWYAASFSLCSALVSVLRFEHEWLLTLAKRYGS